MNAEAFDSREKDSQLVAQAMAGDRRAMTEMLSRVAPAIQKRVAWGLYRKRARAKGRPTHQECADLVQEVFASLFEENGRILKSWKFDGGISLESFVGLVAERQVASILRNGKRSPWTEDPVDSEPLERVVGVESALEESFVSKDLLERVLERLRESLSPKMLQIFYFIWVDERSVSDICAELHMQPESVYMARSRISSMARSIAAELQRESRSEK